MENETVLYYDGISARATTARVLIFDKQLHLYSEEGKTLNVSVPFTDITINRVSQNFFLYLDATHLKYIQYPIDHPLAEVLAREVDERKGSWFQKLLKQRALTLVAIMVVLGIALYFAVISLIPFIGMKIIGVEHEIKIGDKLKDVTLSEAPVFGNKINVKGTELLQQFAGKLQLSQKYPIKVTVVSSDIVNAYAMPGGNIVVYEGILKKMRSPEELVALLAHESSHINQRHTLRALLRSAANGIIISILFGDATGISGALVSNAETLNGLEYSRSLESEADNEGMKLMLNNKVDVMGMKRLMERLQAEEKLSIDLSFFQTHPLTKERIAAADKFVTSHSQQPETRNDLEKNYNELKENLSK